MSLRSGIWQYLKYTLLTTPIIAGLYVPYQIFWIGLSGIQIVKWITTTGLMTMLANLVIQPYLAWLYRRKILK